MLSSFAKVKEHIVALQARESGPKATCYDSISFAKRNNIAFAELCGLLRNLGFDERVRGDHHIFSKAGVAEILNLQPERAQAKPYQVKQVRNVILRYQLAGDSDE